MIGKNSITQLTFATALRDGGQYHKAMQVILPILKNTPNFRPEIIHYMVGDLLDDLGDVQGAINHLKYSIHLDGSNHMALNSLGYIYQKNEMHEEASEMLYRAILVEPTDTRAMFNLSYSLFELGRLRDAIEICRKGKAIISAQNAKDNPFEKLEDAMRAMLNSDAGNTMINDKPKKITDEIAQYECKKCGSAFRFTAKYRYLCGDCGGMHASHDMKCPYCQNNGFLPIGILEKSEEGHLSSLPPIACPICKTGRVSDLSR